MCPNVLSDTLSDMASCIIYATKKYIWMDQNNRRMDIPAKHAVRGG